eukprot:SAG25_NODE_36_length_19907_cov_10.787027_2_plen_177_part_00
MTDEHRYVPEGWWHATTNLPQPGTDDGTGIVGSGGVVGVGGQAAVPHAAGSLALAQSVAPLMEAGRFEEALTLVRLERQGQGGAQQQQQQQPSEEVARSPQVAQLHGDIIMALMERGDQPGDASAASASAVEQPTTSLWAEAAEAFATAARLLGEGARGGAEASAVPASLLLRLGI